jgi:hypothetical protein
MKIKSLLATLLLMLSLSCFAQKDSTASQKFYADFINLYKEISKPPLGNFFEILSTTAKFTFNPYNPYFINALRETSKTLKVEETVALDTLFRRTFASLTHHDLWISSKEIYATQKPLLNVYSGSVCPCLTAEIKRTDMMEQLVAAMKKCIAKLSTDSSFAGRVKNLAGNKTTNDLFALQPYMALNLYEECPVLNARFNQTIMNYPVGEQYFTGLSFTNNREAENAVRYFTSKRYDSLQIIFPGYKKFIADLTKIKTIMQRPGIKMGSNYIRSEAGKPAAVSLTFFKGDLTFAELTLTNAASALQSAITAAKLKIYNPPLKYEGEMIMMSEN